MSALRVSKFVRAIFVQFWSICYLLLLIII